MGWESRGWVGRGDEEGEEREGLRGEVLSVVAEGCEIPAWV